MRSLKNLNIKKSIEQNKLVYSEGWFDKFDRIAFTIYPNPVSDILNIKTQDEVLNVMIYDISGRQINTRINNNQIDVSDLTKGFYIINVVTDRASYQQKFIKKLHFKKRVIFFSIKGN